MKKTGLFYSFNTHKTAQVAQKIKELWEGDIDEINVEKASDDQLMAYDNYIMGVPTWFDGELPNYWDELVPALEDMNFKGKTFAIFGNGDQKGYPENFGDGVGIMAEIVEKQGGKVIGYTEADDYEFESSRALRDGKFVGLLLDFENQARKNNSRIKNWVKQIANQMVS
ncbi:flavodoxin [Salinivirga cyanobacteriivorans]|uniref:Flavodoxin n=1 Tax=Salinivirga cyanobacteriivorans TaxID=1307839 RepID=A0A0S2HW28_9BACT|nr:flavodoxin [Salinivirga cyanobacteriivorans]ALO14180.1 Flavodoxin-B [Salinivirga cyanobacteriivorans]